MRIILGTALFLAMSACGGEKAGTSADNKGSQASSGSVDLTGAGATFPYPLYSKWFSDYAAKTGVRINYQSIGSGGGIRQLSEETVDFGATDGPMTDEELKRAKGGPILHIPTVLGADAITYNLPGVASGLKLTPDVIADIFLGKITKWNDPRIATLNQGVQLPSTDLLVVHRSDGSGTTYIFTDYLTSVSSAWKAGPGKGKEVRWPVGLGAKGNEGVAGQIKQTPGSIGYVELAYAKQNALSVAAVRNSAGEFITPTVEAVTAAAAGAASRLPSTSDYRISIVNAPGAGAYPISSFTWILVYQQQKDSVKSRKLVDFLNWALTEGEAQAAPLDYAPIPESMAANLKARIATIAVAPTR
ncbi:MAG: phosphate ABC transporter substrate-binding protein PstS [Gemmatimonadaceae bacterium]